ncbi:MAG TPA: DinB family protein, partial [Tepidisphaeraceae bacterium]
LLEDLKDAPLTPPTPRGGNHPLWVLGHITFVEAGIPRVLFGEPHPLADWGHLFAPGTEPKPEAAAYPSFDELLKAFRTARARNMQILDQLGEAGLDQPTQKPLQGLEQMMRTAGDTFLILAMHHMHHRGQLADVRRALGRKPLFTPGPN